MLRQRDMALTLISTVSKSTVVLVHFLRILTLFTESLTAVMYWSMVEDGLAVVATSLPTLHYFIARKPVQSMTRSVRSMISIQSLRSRSVPNDQSPSGSSNVEDESIKNRFLHDDIYRLHGVQSNGFDTQVNSNADTESSPVPPLPDHIHVKKEVHQTDATIV